MLLTAIRPLSHVQRKPEFFLRSSLVALLAFASVFFPRVLDSLGAPSAINFAHFAIVPAALFIVLQKCRIRERQQVLIIQLLLFGCLLLLTVILASTLLNQAGLVNAVLSYLLLGEPFIFLIILTALPLSVPRFLLFQRWIRRFCLFHIFLAMFQQYVLQLHKYDFGMEPEDNIQGVFFLSGAGHVVGTSVSLSFGVYYLFTAKDVPLWFRITIMLLAAWQMIIADGKQVLPALVAGWVLLVVMKLKDIVQLIKYLVSVVVFGGAFYWGMYNIPALHAFTVWMRPELYGPEGEATLLKTAAFRIVPQYYDSFLNWFVGLGPGHTVGRLGGWMLGEYASLLNPLGATRHEASGAVWRAAGDSWLGNQSSMFSPLFGWAGIWGDIGILGILAYFFLAYVVWRYIALDDISKILLLSVFATGLIFSQLEEPAYMLTIAAIVGLRWHEIRMEKSGTDIYSYRKGGYWSFL